MRKSENRNSNHIACPCQKCEYQLFSTAFCYLLFAKMLKRQFNFFTKNRQFKIVSQIKNQKAVYRMHFLNFNFYTSHEKIVKA